jgi:hypothetical protein
MLRLMGIMLWLAAAVSLAALPAQAQPQVVIPLPPGASPAWTPIPEARGLDYSPNLQADLFRYGGRYYCYHNGRWYRGSAYTGPWRQVTKLPAPFYQVGPTYFKAAPPGWARGKKTGWRGAPLPPGQMKKYEEGNLPPGQMKKLSR